MKKQTRYTALVAAACLAAATFTSPSLLAADEATPETSAAARRLMKTMEVEQQMAPMWESMRTMQESMLSQQELTDDEKKQAIEVMAASMGEVEKALSWENLEPMMIRVYAGTFSAEEMEKLSQFFETPDGQVYIKKQPQLQQAMMTEMQGLMVGLMPRIQKKTEEVIKKIKEGKPAN